MNDFDKSKGWTTLGIIDNFFLALRDVMFASANVQPVYGYVSGLDFFHPRDDKRRRWRLVTQTKQDSNPRLFCDVDAVFLATGSEPRHSVSAGHMRDKRDLPLTLALDPSRLPSALLDTGLAGEVTVGVVGSSHSGMLAAANLCEVAMPSHWRMRVLCFGRHLVRHAEPIPSTMQYRRNMTGLKGWGSLFARAHRLDQGFRSDTGSPTVEMAQWPPEHLLWEDVDLVVDATGFEPRPLPELRVWTGDTTQKQAKVVPWNAATLVRNAHSELCLPKEMDVVAAAPELHTGCHLYGSGIAFPGETPTEGPDKGQSTERPVGFRNMSIMAGHCAEHLTHNRL